MKKVMSLLLAVMMVLFMSACGGSETKTDNDTSSSSAQNQTDVTDTNSTEQSTDTSSTTTKPSTPTHTQPIEKIGLNTAVTVTSTYPSHLGDLKITVLGFEKTSWKADEYRFNADNPNNMDPAFKALGNTEEIGMLKLIVTKVSYDDTENPDGIHFEDVLKIYDEYEIALTAINTGWDYGSYEVALNEFLRMKKGETTRVAIPYIYDTSNKSLRVVLGEKYEVDVPVVQ